MKKMYDDKKTWATLYVVVSSAYNEKLGASEYDSEVFDCESDALEKLAAYKGCEMFEVRLESKLQKTGQTRNVKLNWKVTPVELSPAD
jgi:hypothetical protein